MLFFKKLLFATTWHSLGTILSYIMVSCKTGAPFIGKVFFFSARHCFSPLIGVYTGTLGASLAFLLSTLQILFFSKSTGTLLLLYHIPSFCAALYLAGHKKALSLLALCCIALFILHPIGAHAWAYTLYWVIPIMMLHRSSFFFSALGSTFVAHAVGSVAWLYAYNLPAKAWLALIPQVAVERVMFAGGMTIAYYAISAAQRYAASRTPSRHVQTYE